MFVEWKRTGSVSPERIEINFDRQLKAVNMRVVLAVIVIVVVAVVSAVVVVTVCGLFGVGA